MLHHRPNSAIGRSVLSESGLLFREGDIGGPDQLVKMMIRNEWSQRATSRVTVLHLHTKPMAASPNVYTTLTFSACMSGRETIREIEKVSVLLFPFPHRVVLGRV